MNKQLRMVETDYYKYVNVNPKDKYGGDCVVRAIANACNQSWETTVREMTELGIKKGFVLNDKHIFPKYLENKGFIKANEPRDEFNCKISVKKFIKETVDIKKYTIVALVGSHHLTCIKNGKIEDIWNASDRTMHRYWFKREA